ncbi:MAG: hypothetical protein Roseis2KO_47060 [Roseivirga sp.]
MKTKAKSIAVLAVLMMCMSSCVYSLFPIYTEDTLVYMPDLVGKWQIGDDPESYLLFEPGFNVDATITVGQPQPEESKGTTTKIAKNFSIEFDGDEYIVQNGDTIRDREKIKAYYEKELEETMEELGVKLAETFEGMAKAITGIAKPGKRLGYSSDDQSYTMTTMHEGQEMKYSVHLAQIGEDIFMDLYPTDSDMSNIAFESMVWFPVHMFMKMELKDDRLILTHFDLDKMNKLFDSNLIRIGHEKIEGSILITAKSEEIQKFFDKYSNDESVFDSVEEYQRITQ